MDDLDRTRTKRLPGESYGDWMRRKEGTKPPPTTARGRAAHVLALALGLGLVAVRLFRTPVTRPAWLVAFAIGLVAIGIVAYREKRLSPLARWALLLVGAAGFFLGWVLSYT